MPRVQGLRQVSWVDRKGALKRMRTAYREVFAGESDGVKIVLADLEQFCCARAQTYTENPFESAFNSGKRDVWLRIQNTLGLTEEQIDSIATRAKLYFEEAEL